CVASIIVTTPLFECGATHGAWPHALDLGYIIKWIVQHVVYIVHGGRLFGHGLATVHTAHVGALLSHTDSVMGGPKRSNLRRVEDDRLTGPGVRLRPVQRRYGHGVGPVEH